MTATKSDILLETENVLDTHGAGAPTHSRLRIGYPRDHRAVGAARTDVALAQAITASVPLERLPSYDAEGRLVAADPAQAYVDVRRALGVEPATGVASYTGGRFALFAKGNVETRVVDGSVSFSAVDQSFEAVKGKSNGAAAGLSYLRLGKALPELMTAENQPLERRHDQLMDQKYQSGIGLFSDGGLNAWTRKPLSFRSNEAFYITSPAYSLSSYGESKITTYELSRKEDIEKVNSGAFADLDVDRRIINFNWLRPTSMGWYRQIFDRGKTLAYTTSNKGEFGIGAAYSLGVGAKFEHAVAVGLGTSFAGKVDVSKGFSVEIGATGATFKHPFGSWTSEIDAELSAYASVKLAVNGFDTIAIKAAMTGLSAAIHGAVAAQTAAFTAYNAVLAAKADTTLTAADAQDKGDDTHGLLTALEHGVRIYEAAISLSAITCAAGIVIGAVQAGWAAARAPDPLMPSVELTPAGIKLACGPTGIMITQAGIQIVAPTGLVTIGGAQVSNMSPNINNLPVLPPPLL